MKIFRSKKITFSAIHVRSRWLVTTKTTTWSGWWSWSNYTRRCAFFTLISKILCHLQFKKKNASFRTFKKTPATEHIVIRNCIKFLSKLESFSKLMYNGTCMCISRYVRKATAKYQHYSNILIAEFNSANN